MAVRKEYDRPWCSNFFVRFIDVVPWGMILEKHLLSIKISCSQFTYVKSMLNAHTWQNQILKWVDISYLNSKRYISTSLIPPGYFVFEDLAWPCLFRGNVRSCAYVLHFKIRTNVCTQKYYKSLIWKYSCGFVVLKIFWYTNPPSPLSAI